MSAQKWKKKVLAMCCVWLLIVEFAWSGPKRIKNQEPDKQTNINEALENRFNHAASTLQLLQ